MVYLQLDMFIDQLLAWGPEFLLSFRNMNEKCNKNNCPLSCLPFHPQRLAFTCHFLTVCKITCCDSSPYIFSYKHESIHFWTPPGSVFIPTISPQSSSPPLFSPHPSKAPHLSHQRLQRGAKDVLLAAEGRQDVVEVKGGPHLAGATRQDANLTRGRRMGEDGEDDGLKESSYRPPRNL